MVSKKTRNVLKRSIFREQYINNIKNEPTFPPIISTRSFSDDLINKFSNLDKIPVARCGKKKLKPGNVEPMVYTTLRYDGKMRFLELPHPWPYARLGDFLIRNWDDITPFCSTKESKTSVAHAGEERIITFNNYGLPYHKRLIELNHFDIFQKEEYKWVIEDVSLRSKFKNAKLVLLDIANFFPSIYTHSLDWVLTGFRKKVNSEDLGPQLDKYTRETRSSRTDGISIGPITSNIISEIVLNEIDKCLLEEKKKGILDFRRAVDDISIIMAGTVDEARIIRRITEILFKYSLYLNVAKTKIVSLQDYLATGVSIESSQLATYTSLLDSRKGVAEFFSLLRKFKNDSDYSFLRYYWPSLKEKILSNRSDVKLLLTKLKQLDLDRTPNRLGSKRRLNQAKRKEYRRKLVSKIKHKQSVFILSLMSYY